MEVVIAKFLIPEQEIQGLIDGLGFQIIEGEKVATHQFKVIDLGFQKLAPETMGDDGELLQEATFSEKKEIDLVYSSHQSSSIPVVWEEFRITPENGGNNKTLGI